MKKINSIEFAHHVLCILPALLLIVPILASLLFYFFPLPLLVLTKKISLFALPSKLSIASRA